jgi:MFS family permease
LVWIRARFAETLPEADRGETPSRLQNPLKAVMRLESPAVRRINLVAFTFALAFCAMEFSLTFLGVDRFGYTARQNGLAIGFLGLCSILTQGVIVRRLLPRIGEIPVLRLGLVCASLGLLVIGLAPTPGWLYTGLAVLAIGAGLVNPASSGLISLYSERREQGRVLGLFRSLGSLARALTPVLAGVAFWLWGGGFVFFTAAGLAALALVFALPLPRPER